MRRNYVFETSISDDLPVLWLVFCMDTVGHDLPINFIDFDEEAGIGEVGFEVEDDDAPIHLLNGKVVRQLSLAYHYEQVLRNERNFN